MKRKIGLITIGQSPRPDIINEMRKILGLELEIVESGALDGLSKEKVLALNSSSGPSGQGYLVTRLRDGTIVTVPKVCVIEGIGSALQEFHNQNIGVAAVLCVGDFPEYSFDGVFIRPGELLIQLVKALQIKGKGILVIPLEKERQSAAQRWDLPGLDCKIKVLPIGADWDFVCRLSEEVKAEDPRFVVLECLGYTERMKACIRDKVNCPVILPKSLLAYVLKETM
jgi:protein AroM